MKIRSLIWILFTTFAARSSHAQQQPRPVKTNPITPEEARVILPKSAELPFVGKHHKAECAN